MRYSLWLPLPSIQLPPGLLTFPSLLSSLFLGAWRSGEVSVHNLPPPEQERHEGGRRVALLSDFSTVGQRVAELGSMTRSTKDLNRGLS